MTDSDIIKALECCCKNNNCEGCPLDYLTFSSQCASEIAIKSLDLINRQKAENERLEKELMKCKLEKEMLHQIVEEIKSEAYKECLAKVKNYIKTHCNPYGKPDFDYDTSIKILNFIGKLTKEMVGENNG